MAYKNWSIGDMIGKKVVTVEGLEKDSEEVIFNCEDGLRFRLHNDDYSNVSLEEFWGGKDVIEGQVLLLAETVEHKDESPLGTPDKTGEDSYTWTFYRFGTAKGYLDLRWFGTSNGYYSESANLEIWDVKRQRWDIHTEE